MNTIQRLIRLASLAVLGSAALLPIAATAQTYPSKPIKIMVGASPGGGTDLIARMLAEKLTASLKQPVVVENRAGASNTIAAEVTAKAAPDGYTLLVATTTGQAIAPHLLKLNYDALKDIAPIGMVMAVPNVLVVGSGVQAKNVSELIAEIRAKPDTYQYASSGIGSTQHIAGEAFAARTGLKLLHVPYRGSSQAHIDLIGGSVQMMFDTTSSAMPQINGGKLRPLAVTSGQRAGVLPNTPTLMEAGVKDLDMTTWYGLFTTGGTGEATTKLLIDELKRILALPEVQKRIADLGGMQIPLYGDEFKAFNQREFATYRTLIKEANIQSQ
jgi:tripartite-type tricarboxylate transporter receptor subunit TctC